MNAGRTAKKLAHELQVLASEINEERTRGADRALGEPQGDESPSDPQTMKVLSGESTRGAERAASGESTRGAERAASGESTRDLATSLGHLSQLLGEAPQLAEVLAHPALSAAGLAELLQEAASDLGPVGMACMQTLCETRALNLLPDMVVELTRLADEEEGLAEARITTARPMDEGLRQRVIQALEKSLGKKIRLVETTDAGLLGGIQIEVQDNIFDGSIRGQLEAMREELSAA